MVQLTKEQRRLALRLRARGWLLREIGAQLDCSHETVRQVLLGRIRPGRPDVWSPASGRLSLADREEISLGLRAGETFTAAAEAGIGPGGPISGPGNAPVDPSPRSWPTGPWWPRWSGGCRSGGHRRRSLVACALSSPTIR